MIKLVHMSYSLCNMYVLHLVCVCEEQVKILLSTFIVIARKRGTRTLCPFFDSTVMHKMRVAPLIPPVTIVTTYFFLFVEALKMLLLTLGKKFNF